MAQPTDDEALHYLPPGWTEEQYTNAKDEDFEDLPDYVLERNMQRMTAESRLIAASDIASIHASDAAVGRPLRSLKPYEHPLVKCVEDSGWEDFGFLVFRTDFSDNARWERFLDEWNDILDAPVEAAGPYTGIPRIKDKVFMKVVDDDVMRHKSPAEVAIAFRLFKDDDDVEPGLDTKMCLMVDAECISSVIDARSQDEAAVAPFVKAVDVTLAHPEPLSSTYQGCFKVAIAALVLDFYLALDKCTHPSELEWCTNPVWEGPA